jgi:multiphosphoryl transfer protein
MTVGLVIVSHSAQLAKGVAELAGQMARGNVPIAAAGGAGETILGTSADIILQAIQEVDSPSGVLLLLDMGSAILSAEMALEMLSDEQRQHVQLSFAPLVEGAIAAANSASLGRTLAEVKQAAEAAANREQLQEMKPFTPAEAFLDQPGTPATPPSTPTETISAFEVQLTLHNPTGLHARPASLFVQTASRFQATIQVQSRGRQTEATSLLGILSLGARKDDTLTIRANGPDAEAALAALSELIEANFYETATSSKPPAPSPPQTSPTETMTLPTPDLPQQTLDRWQGIPVSTGVALGPVFLYTSHTLPLSLVERRTISASQVAAEQQRLQDALTQTSQELHALAQQLQSQVGQAEAGIFDAQALMLDDPQLREAALQTIKEQNVDAASALAIVGAQQAATLEALDDPLLAARATDVRDSVSRAIQHLRGGGETPQDLSTLSQPVILVARDLTPSDTAQLRPDTVLGICTVHGGPTAHAAILARALSIPAIAGLNEALLQLLHPGEELGLDADKGLLYLHPSKQIHDDLAQRLATRQQQQVMLKAAAQQAQAPLLINGRRIQLLANVGSKTEAEAARQWGAEGIGLLRTEFLLANTATLPDEAAQRQRYVEVFQAFRGNSSRPGGPIVVRTLDAGADKPMPALQNAIGLTAEANPALGLRGIRIHLAYQHLLEQQLSALLLAAADTGVELHIMFPMITTVEEVREARSIFERVYQRLKQGQGNVAAQVPLGIMVEVPAAVVMAPELAEVADFFSIGSNDLLQYVLACDRTNASVAHLYNPMQPALLRMIRQVAEAGRRAGKPVAVCGEIASDTRLAPILVGLGVDELSMTPTALLAVRTALKEYPKEKLTELAEKVCSMSTVAEVEATYEQFRLQ